MEIASLWERGPQATPNAITKRRQEQTRIERAFSVNAQNLRG